MAKAYCNVSSNGTLQGNSYNISSVNRIGAGDYDINLANTFANANYTVLATVQASTDHFAQVGNPTTVDFDVLTWDVSLAARDDALFHCVAFGEL